MSQERFCPECGAKIENDERFCQNCGTALPVEEEPQGGLQEGAKDEPMIGAGARVNATGGIHRTSHQNVNVNTSQVDNSQTVNNTTNHTTIVMNKEEAQYCEVCGNPLEEKHPRCPKCGKQICFDCKVKGKNRCIECEKKAQEAYRVAFQQLLLTTNGNLGSAGRQIMNQKARELDVEDVKNAIEKELMEAFRATAPRAEQPTVVAATAAAATAAATAAANSRPATQQPVNQPAEQKGLGALSGGQGVRPQTKGGETGGGSKTLWFILGGLAAVIVIILLAVSGKEDASKQPEAVPTEASAPAATTSAPTTAPTAAPRQSAPAASPAQTAKPAAQPVAQGPDANYEAGMKAYNAGEGLEAISCFKKSGSAKSNYMLGVIYENGCGNVGSNAMMARKFYKKAAAQGSAEAKAKL